MLFRSSAIANPAIVIIRAAAFIYQGIVITCTVVGGMLYEIKKPARILPRASRLIGLISNGLFSLMVVVVENRGLVIRTK